MFGGSYFFDLAYTMPSLSGIPLLPVPKKTHTSSKLNSSSHCLSWGPSIVCMFSLPYRKQHVVLNLCIAVSALSGKLFETENSISYPSVSSTEHKTWPLAYCRVAENGKGEKETEGLWAVRA
jgi:hypothetical protein